MLKFNRTANPKTRHMKRKKGSPALVTDGRLVGWKKEEHGQPVFGVSFWPGRAAVYHLSTAGGNELSVYEVTPGVGVDRIQSYVDEDEDEMYYACAWSANALLAAAGHQGIVKVVDCAKREVDCALVGHGNSINDLCFHPVDAALLLTASKDESIRLWNTRTAVCVAIFAGDRGHRDEVLSVDAHVQGGAFCSSGMDNTVKVWRLDTPKVQAAVKNSHVDPAPPDAPFKTVSEQFPLFSTAKVHSNYVDCARWTGSLIVSKSTANKLVQWTPDPARAARTSYSPVDAPKTDDALVLRDFDLPAADIWFLRFAVDPAHDLMAAGNTNGKVHVWRIDDTPTDDAPATPRVKIHHSKANSPVRQVAFSPDSKLVAFCCDDASVWVFDVSERAPLSDAAEARYATPPEEEDEPLK